MINNERQLLCHLVSQHEICTAIANDLKAAEKNLRKQPWIINILMVNALDDVTETLLEDAIEIRSTIVSIMNVRCVSTLKLRLNDNNCYVLFKSKDALYINPINASLYHSLDIAAAA